MRDQSVDHLGGDSTCLQFAACLGLSTPAHQRLGLRKAVGDQFIVVTLQWMLTAQGQNEVGRNQPGTLVDQLEEAVLRVGAGLAPDHSAGGIVDRDAITGDPFAVALHVQLLQEGREMLEVLVVGDHRLGVGPAEIVVPDAEQRQDDRHIAFRRRLDEMLVHRVGTGQ